MCRGEIGGDSESRQKCPKHGNIHEYCWTLEKRVAALEQEKARLEKLANCNAYAAVVENERANSLVQSAVLPAPTWRRMDDPMPPEGQMLICWSTGEMDCIDLAEYLQIMEFGEPPARGWLPLSALPAPPAEDARS